MSEGISLNGVTGKKAKGLSFPQEGRVAPIERGLGEIRFCEGGKDGKLFA